MRSVNAAVEHQFPGNLYAGIEIRQRNVKVPLILADGTVERWNWKELQPSAHIYWLQSSRLAASAEVRLGRFGRPREDMGIEGFTDLRSIEVPLSIRLFGPSKLTTAITLRYVKQRGDFVDPNGPTGFETLADSDQAWVLDLAFGFRFPKRGIYLALEAKNLTDERFRYQDFAVQDATIQQRENFAVSTRRAVFGRVGVAF